MLYYCPFECRPDRYTMQLSAPNTGWNERAWRRHGIQYRRIDAWSQHNPEDAAAGTIFDLPSRSRWCLQQTIMLLRCYEEGALTHDDIIYFDDVLHPGIEALGLSILDRSKRPRMFGWLHGTYFDPKDFLRRAGPWAGFYEKMAGSLLDGVFVACPELKSLWLHHSEVSEHLIHATGHVWDTEEVKGRMPAEPQLRQNMVVYASRWDACKDPLFFLDVARRVRNGFSDVDARFIVCSSADTVQSDDPQLLEHLKRAVAEGAVELYTGLSKQEYYTYLSQAKVVFSSSQMDWISYVLLEGSLAGAWPIFPRNWCFEKALRGDDKFLYPPGDVEAAVNAVVGILNCDNKWTPEALSDRAWIHERFDSTWSRRLSAMGLLEGSAELEEWAN